MKSARPPYKGVFPVAPTTFKDNGELDLPSQLRCMDFLIDAGANAKAIQTFMGHSKIQTTFDTYGHLMPGSHDEVRERMDAYLENEPASVG